MCGICEIICGCNNPVREIEEDYIQDVVLFLTMCEIFLMLLTVKFEIIYQNLTSKPDGSAILFQIGCE